MLQKKILVPLGTGGNDLKSVHYALSLAERLEARVFILQQAIMDEKVDPHEIWLTEALADLINSARLAGISVSYHIGEGEFKKDIIDLVKEEHIGVLVIGEGDGIGDVVLSQIKPLITSQIIQVKEKNNINYL